MRLIDADELRERKWRSATADHNEHGQGWNDCLDYIIANAPTIDAVPLEQYAKLADESIREYNEHRRATESTDTISRADAIEAVHKYFVKEIDKTPHEIDEDGFDVYTDMPTVNSLLACNKELSKELKALPSAEAVQGWTPCSERLPKINQEVLLSTADGKVFVGHREKPDLVWQVTETDGRKHWVYDPEAYTDDVDGLPKAEDCGFDKDSPYSDGLLSVTSVNYDNRFDGVTAWMPLPTPYKGGDDE